MAEINTSKLEELVFKESALKTIKNFLKLKETHSQYIQEFKSSADVNISSKQLREEKFNCLLEIYDKNQSLWKKIVTKGRSSGEGMGNIIKKEYGGKEEKIAGAKYYPCKGIFITSKKGGSNSYRHPNLNHCSSNTSWYDFIYYIPKEKKFISVAIQTVYGHTAGFCGTSYSNKSYNGFKEIDKSKVLKSVDFRKIISSLKNYGKNRRDNKPAKKLLVYMKDYFH